MRKVVGVLLVLGGFSVAVLAQKKDAPPPACQDEETMVTDYEQSLNELVGTVRDENMEHFQRAYHRKSALTKLTLCTGIVDVAVACFDRSAQDSATPKEQAETYKAKRDAFAKLKEKVVQYRDSLKAAEMDKDAKPLIEKMEFPD